MFGPLGNSDLPMPVVSAVAAGPFREQHDSSRLLVVAISAAAILSPRDAPVPSISSIL